MLQYMLDTDTCIYVMREVNPTKLTQRVIRHSQQLCISSITLSELHYGAEKSAKRLRNLEEIEEFTARLDVLAFSEKAASHYGQLRVELERKGKLIGAHDMLIGAHARSEGLIVVTNNTREFGRMPGLRVENWV